MVRARIGGHSNRIIWNQHKFLKYGDMRTISSLESWYGKIQKLVDKKKPAYENFFEFFQDEQRNTENLLLDMAQNKPTTHPRKSKQTKFNNVTKKAKEFYYGVDILEHLEGIAIALMGFGL